MRYRYSDDVLTFDLKIELIAMTRFFFVPVIILCKRSNSRYEHTSIRLYLHQLHSLAGKGQVVLLTPYRTILYFGSDRPPFGLYWSVYGHRHGIKGKYPLDILVTFTLRTRQGSRVGESEISPQYPVLQQFPGFPHSRTLKINHFLFFSLFGFVTLQNALLRPIVTPGSNIRHLKTNINGGLIPRKPATVIAAFVAL